MTSLDRSQGAKLDLRCLFLNTLTVPKNVMLALYGDFLELMIVTAVILHDCPASKAQLAQSVEREGLELIVAKLGPFYGGTAPNTETGDAVNEAVPRIIKLELF